MLKRNKWWLVISSAAILLPVAVGLILWDRLPAQIPIHFGPSGQPDRWAGKAIAVFALAGAILVLHWICILVTAADPKRKNIDDKAFRLLLCICPMTYLVVSSIMYGVALGMKVNVIMIVMLLIGVLLILLGNYVPKNGQNYAFGIRTPWALNDPENWKQTHRVAGWSMFLCGALILATAWLQNIWLLLGIILVFALAPVVYSFVYYLRHRE